jgi:hypothetical protein
MDIEAHGGPGGMVPGGPAPEPEVAPTEGKTVPAGNFLKGIPEIFRVVVRDMDTGMVQAKTRKESLCNDQCR